MRTPWHPHQLADLTDQTLTAYDRALATKHGTRAWVYRTWVLAEQERRIATQTDHTTTHLLTIIQTSEAA